MVLYIVSSVYSSEYSREYIVSSVYSSEYSRVYTVVVYIAAVILIVSIRTVAFVGLIVIAVNILNLE